MRCFSSLAIKNRGFPAAVRVPICRPHRSAPGRGCHGYVYSGLGDVFLFENAASHPTDDFVGLLAFLAEDFFGVGPFGSPLGEAVH